MKKTGKALSLVLSLALVASSIPAALASAATTVKMTQTAVPTFAAVYDPANLGLGNSTGKGEVALSKIFAGQSVDVQEDKSKVATLAGLDFSKATFSVSSNGSVVKLNTTTHTANTAGDVTSWNSDKAAIADVGTVAKIEGGGTSSGTTEAIVTASNVAVSGDVNLEVSKHNNLDEVKNGTVTLTAKIEIYNNSNTNKTIVVAPVAPADTKPAVLAATVGINDTSEFKAYSVGVDSDALVKYGADTSALKFTGSALTADTTTNGASGDLKFTAQDPTKLPTSTITSTVFVADSTNPTTQKANTIAATLTVGTYYTAADADTTTVSKVYGTPTKTLIGTYDVTNRAIHVGSGVTLNVSGEDASVGTITVAGGTVLVKSGSIGAITGTGTVNVGTAFDTNKGNITIGDVTVLHGDTVTIAGSIQANDDKTFSSIKVGNIAAGTVAITTKQNPDKTAMGQVTVGNVTAFTAINVATSQDVKTLTAGSFSGVQGEYADCPYTATFTLSDGVLTTGDLQYFQKVVVGSATTVANLTAGNIDTGTFAKANGDAANSTVYGYSFDNAAAASTISILNNSKLAVASLTVQSIPTSCAGSLTIPAGKLTLADSSNPTDEAANSGITLYVPNATVGTVLYTSNKKAANVFTVPGIDTIASTPNANNVYSYSASKTTFIGFQMNQTVVNLGSNASTTLTTTNLPAGALPTGVSLKWESDKKTVTLAPSADTTSCVVTAAGYTPTNVNGGNNVVVTATLVNKDGSAYTPVASSDKTVGTCSITLTPTVTPTLTTKVTDLDGNTVVATPDMVIPMQQSTQYRVQFNADVAGISNINYFTGNDKVAQTGTVSAWNGTSGTYTIYTNGAVGSKVGVFANGVKIFQVQVTDRPFKCDTTCDFTMKAGKTYSFKITPVAGTKINTFTFLTGKDSALSTWGCKLNADGTATATVKAVSAGTYGVYATINGKNYKVFAITVQ